MKRLTAKLALLLIPPALVLALSVFLARPQWYKAAERDVARDNINYVFIGSSRVAAAIDESTFSTVMKEHLGRPVHALNVGQGYSTPIEHYLGLRRLFRIAPDHMKGCVIFLEAPGGIADLGGWDGPWVNTEQPELMLDVMSVRDLPLLWHSQATLATKLSIMSVIFTRPKAVLLSSSNRIRIRIRGWVEALAMRLLARNGGASVSSTGADLSTNGGIRADVMTVQRARVLAVTRSERSLECQRVRSDWNSPVYDALRQLVEQHDGTIVLYDIPQSSSFSRLDHTDIGKSNQEGFRRNITRMHTEILSPSFSYSDSDFPDLWHLRKSRSSEFTEALARAYIQELAPKKASPF